VDNKQHNIAEVSLKDMYCTTDVKDKKGAKSVSPQSFFRLFMNIAFCFEYFNVNDNTLLFSILIFQK
jgi:hypothetical protein